MTSDQIKSGIMLAGIGIAAIVAWKVYKAGSAAGDYISSLPGRIGDTMTSAGDSLTAAGNAVMPQYVIDRGGLWETNLAVVNAVNPASDQNLIYSGVSAVGSAVSGDKYWTLGGAVYEYFNPDVYASTTINTAAQTDAKRISTGGASGSY